MTADPGVMRADISPSPNGDGRVDVNDLLAVLALYGCEAVEDVGSGENAVWGDELNGPPVRLVASGFAEPSLNGAFSRIEGVLSCSPADARTPHGTVYKSTRAERFLHRFGSNWYMAQAQCAIEQVYAMFDAGGADGFDGFAGFQPCESGECGWRECPSGTCAVSELSVLSPEAVVTMEGQSMGGSPDVVLLGRRS